MIALNNYIQELVELKTLKIIEKKILTYSIGFLFSKVQYKFIILLLNLLMQSLSYCTQSHSLYQSDLIQKYHSNTPKSKSIDNKKHLPINLFHSPAQYNKMLITNGKNVQSTSPLEDGFIEDLQFLNQPYFLASQHQAKARRKRYSQLKNSDNMTDLIRYSLNQRQAHSFKHSLAETLKKNYLKSQVKQINRSSNRWKDKSEKKRRNSRKKVITSKKNIEVEQKIFHPEQSSSLYLSQKVYHIDQLIERSLSIFEERKKKMRNTQAKNREAQLLRKSFLRSLDQKIRDFNKKYPSYPKQRTKSLSSKSTVAFQYWKSVQEEIKSALKKKVKKFKEPKKDDQLQNYHPKMSIHMMYNLSKIYGKKAMKKLKQESIQKKIQEKMKKLQLKELQRKRKECLDQCKKIKFKPTKEMIENAFLKME